MGKRSDFKRNNHDKYVTTATCIPSLLPHLRTRGTRFLEPCAGNGALVKLLTDAGHTCVYASDLHPSRLVAGAEFSIAKRDALEVTKDDMETYGVQDIITNPPWTRELLHPMIEHFRSLGSTWLLFDADWMHTVQAAPIIDRCDKVVSIGRVKWIPDSLYFGKDNAAWYHFPMRHRGGPVFVPRLGKEAE